MKDELVPVELIENKIYMIRGQKVMLDRDLAELYGVDTGYLNRQVRHNTDRFPGDFMFQLSNEEYENLKCKLCISSWGGRRFNPLVFTEQGVAMLSGILRSKRAVYVNIAIMRAFVRLRQILSSHKELAQKFEQLEKRVFKHNSDIRELVKDIRRLTMEKTGKKLRIGFLK